LFYNLILTEFDLIGFIFLSILITGILFYVYFSVKSISKISKIDNHYKLLICIMIIPFIRIAELFMDFGFFYEFVIISVMLIFAVFYFSYYFKIKIRYTSDCMFLIPLIILIGELFGFLGYIILDIPEYSNFSYLFLLIIPLISYAQEIYFRGLIQNLIKKKAYSFLFPGLIYFSVVLIFGFKPALFLVLVFFVFSFVYLKTKNIILTILGNIAMGLVLFGMPVIF